MAEHEAGEPAPKVWRGRLYEDFDVGDCFRSRVGRTITEAIKIEKPATGGDVARYVPAGQVGEDSLEPPGRRPGAAPHPVRGPPAPEHGDRLLLRSALP